MTEVSALPPVMPSEAPYRLLLIGGPPGSGKGWLTERLVQRYGRQGTRALPGGAGSCGKDDIKEVLFDTLGAGDAAWSRRLSDASFALLFRLVSRLLRPGALLVLEGNFRPGEQEPALRAALDVQDTRLAQVLVHASTATRSARLLARERDPRRHPAHRDGLRDARADERPAAQGFLDLPGPRLSFDSDAPEQQALPALYVQLDAWCGCEPCTSGPPAA